MASYVPGPITTCPGGPSSAQDVNPRRSANSTVTSTTEPPRSELVESARSAVATSGETYWRNSREARDSISRCSRRRANSGAATTITAKKATWPGPRNAASGSVATRSDAIAAATHRNATVPAALSGGITVARASVAMVRPRDGRTHAAAVQSRRGSASEAKLASTEVMARTAVARIIRRWEDRTGHAMPTSYVGSTPGPNAAATPPNGSSGATTRNRKGSWLPYVARMENPRAMAVAPNQDTRSEGVAASRRATWSGTYIRTSR